MTTSCLTFAQLFTVPGPLVLSASAGPERNACVERQITPHLEYAGFEVLHVDCTAVETSGCRNLACAFFERAKSYFRPEALTLLTEESARFAGHDTAKLSFCIDVIASVARAAPLVVIFDGADLIQKLSLDEISSLRAALQAHSEQILPIFVAAPGRNLDEMFSFPSQPFYSYAPVFRCQMTSDEFAVLHQRSISRDKHEVRERLRITFGKPHKQAKDDEAPQK